MKIQPIITKLTADCPAATAVVLASGISTVDATDLPLIYVHPATEEADRTAYDNLVVQNFECKFSLMIAAAADGDALETIRDQSRNSMLGYVIDSDYDAIEYDSGELLEISASTIWWRDTFVCNRYVRQQ